MIMVPPDLKAKSRLSVDIESPPHRPRLKEHVPFSFAGYFKTFPTFILGVIGYAVSVLIVTTLYPVEIRDIGGTGMYLPLLLSLCWGNFFFLTYITQSLVRGGVYSGIFGLLLIGHLHGVISSSVIMVVFISLLFIDLLLTLKKPKR
jgi:hypothetical protein